MLNDINAISLLPYILKYPMLENIIFEARNEIVEEHNKQVYKQQSKRRSQEIINKMKGK